MNIAEAINVAEAVMAFAPLPPKPEPVVHPHLVLASAGLDGCPDGVILVFEDGSMDFF